MCWCDSKIRTPCCGKNGCVDPRDKEKCINCQFWKPKTNHINNTWGDCLKEDGPRNISGKSAYCSCFMKKSPLRTDDDGFSFISEPTDLKVTCKITVPPDYIHEQAVLIRCSKDILIHLIKTHCPDENSRSEAIVLMEKGFDLAMYSLGKKG